MINRINIQTRRGIYQNKIRKYISVLLYILSRCKVNTILNKSLNIVSKSVFLTKMWGGGGGVSLRQILYLYKKLR
jgi:hypothetical protein